MELWRFSLPLLFFILVAVEAGDMLKKSIVFDKKTPGVFYCPQHKPSGIDKMIVRARPLKKLCEFDGKGVPEDVKPDCYDNVDESEYACKEKKRIMMRLHPPGSEDIKIDQNNNNKWEKASKNNKNVKRKVRVRKQRIIKEQN